MESFNGKLRYELLNRELFLSLEEARYVLDEWRRDYNHRCLHSLLNWQTLAAFSVRLADISTGAFPAALPAEPPAEAAPVPMDQQAPSIQPILSKELVQRTWGGQLEHAMRRYRYVLDCGGKIVLVAVAKLKSDYSSARKVFEDTQKMEIENTQVIY